MWLISRKSTLVVAMVVTRYILLMLSNSNTKNVLFVSGSSNTGGISGIENDNGVDLPTCPICQDYDPFKCQLRMLLLHGEDDKLRLLHYGDDHDQCHVDDDWALIYCQESYLVCIPNLIVPNVGVIPLETTSSSSSSSSQHDVVTIRQRIPLPISLEIAQVSRQTHINYYNKQ